MTEPGNGHTLGALGVALTGAGAGATELSPELKAIPEFLVRRESRWMLQDDLAVTEDGSAEGGGGLRLHAGHDVLVDGHGERDAAVA